MALPAQFFAVVQSQSGGLLVGVQANNGRLESSVASEPYWHATEPATTALQIAGIQLSTGGPFNAGDRDDLRAAFRVTGSHVLGELTLDIGVFNAFESTNTKVYNAIIDTWVAAGTLTFDINNASGTETFTIQLRALRTLDFTFVPGTPATLQPVYASGTPSSNFHTNVDNVAYSFAGPSIVGANVDGSLILKEEITEPWMLAEGAARQLVISDPSATFESHFEINVLGDLTRPTDEMGGAPGEDPDPLGGQGGDANPESTGGNPTSGDGDGDASGDGDGDGSGDGDGDSSGDGDGDGMMPGGTGGTGSMMDPEDVPTGGGKTPTDDAGCGCHMERRAPTNFLWVTPAVLLWLRTRRPIPRRLAWWRKI